MKKHIFILFILLYSPTILLGQCEGNEPDEPSFSYTDICGDNAIIFTVDNPESDLEYNWSFNEEGESVTYNIPSNQTSNQFEVILTVTNDDGCSNETMETIDIDPYAILNSLNFTNCQGGSFELNVNDGSLGDITNYMIDWGDGSMPFNSSSAPVGEVHLYENIGIYLLTYTVTSSNGCTSTFTTDIINITNPAVGISIPGNTEGTAPIEFCFPINDTEDNYSSTIYYIDFGDGLDTILNHPPPLEICHTYLMPSCEVDGFTLVCIAENGCAPSTSSVGTMNITTIPIPSFTVQGGCIGQGISITNNTTLGFDGNCSNQTQFEWDFGDGSDPLIVFESINTNPQIIYDTPGNYQISLTTSNGANNAENPSITEVVNICIEGISDLSIELVNAPNNTICQTEVLSINNLSDLSEICGEVAVEWTANSPLVEFDDSLSLTPNISFNDSGNFDLTFQLLNGCGESITIPIIVNPAPNVTINQNPIETIPCGSYELNATDYLQINGVVDDEEVTWTFSGDTSLIVTGNIPPILSLDPGNYNVSVSFPDDCNEGNTIFAMVENIIVNAEIPVQILENNTSLCQGDSITLTASGTTNYLWSTNETSSSITVAPNVTTTYFVTAEDTCATTDSITLTINTAELLNLPSISICPSIEPFNLEAPIEDGIWTGMGITDSMQGTLDPSIITESTIITYTVPDANDCPAIGTIDIVFAQPNASFSLPDTSCNSNSIELTTQIQNPQWLINGVEASEENIFSYMPDALGAVEITLIDESFDIPCQDTITHIVEIIEAPSVENINFTLDADTLCANEMLVINNTSLNTNFDFMWVLGEDTLEVFEPTDIILQEAQSGNDTTYMISLFVENAPCTPILKEQSIVIQSSPQPNLGISDSTLCSNDEIILYNNSIGLIDTSYIIFPNNETIGIKDTLIHNFENITTDTVYSIQLVTVNKCDTIITERNIYILPDTLIAGFENSNTTLCQQIEAIFIDNSIYSESIDWYINDIFQGSEDTLIFLPEIAGEYSITQIAKGCGTDTATTTINVAEYDLIQGIMIYNNTVCQNEEITLEAIHEIGSINWYINDEDTINNQNSIDYIFTESGEYSITIESITPTNACQYDTVIVINVTPKPQANFFIDTTNVCGGTTVNFSSQSDNDLIHNWDFGNGESSNQINPEVVYETPSTITNYPATLTVIDDFCEDDTTIIVTTYPLPTSDFILDPYNFCEIPAMIETTNQSSNDAIQYYWIVNETDTVSTQSNPTLNFEEEGIYEIMLIAENQFNCQDISSQIVQVYSPPIIESINGETSICQYESIIFSTSMMQNVEYLWNFGDGNTSTESAPEHIYEQTGNFEVSLIVTNEYNCTDTLDNDFFVEVLAAPTAGFTIDTTQGCLGQFEINLENTSTNYTSISMDFGDGVNENIFIDNYTYETAGEYNITLTVENEIFCTNTHTQNIQVHPVPVISIDPPIFNICANTNTTLEPNVTPSETIITWNVEGAEYTQATLSQEFTEVGENIIFVQASYQDICFDYDTIIVNVLPSPIADFIWIEDTFINNAGITETSGSVNFLDISSNDVTEWNWNVNDTTYTIPQFQHQFESNGTYETELIVSNGVCQDSIIKDVSLKDFNHLNVPNALKISSENDEARQFLPKGVNLITYELFIYDESGILLWHNNELDENGTPIKGWDGTHNGKVLPEGIYTWRIEASFQSETWAGYIADPRLWNVRKKNGKNTYKKRGTVLLIH